MVIGDVKLDIGKIKIPIYNLAAKEDHIAPARSVFNGAKLFGGEMRYVIGGSGHIAGVINPPGPKPKYQYWTGEKPSGAYRGLGAPRREEHAGLVVAGLDRTGSPRRRPRRSRRANPAAARSAARRRARRICPRQVLS